MGRSITGVALALVAASAVFARADDKPRTYPNSGGRLVWDRVRFRPAPGYERDMVGGKFSGSNVSATEGYETLAVIHDAPTPDQWTELTFDGKRPHRWIRYEAPPGSYGHIAKLEFYAGPRRLGGSRFGSIGRKNPGRDWPRVFDANPKAFFESDRADGQYVGIDIGDAATAVRPALDPPPGDYPGTLRVSLKCPTPGATIRYTVDGTTPGPDGGLPYRGPIDVSSTTTLTAVARKDGFALSPPSSGTYLIGPPAEPGLVTFHIGNSITATTGGFSQYARTAGYRHRYEKYLQPGILTSQLWTKHATTNNADWNKTLASLTTIEHFTVQPREMRVENEAKHEALFFDLIRRKSPGMQPWLYAEWTDLYRSRPTDQGKIPIPCRQMKALSPALTWEESAAAMLLYVEEVRDLVLETYKEGKRPRVLPSVLAAGWVKNLLDHGKIPGLGREAFEPLIFFDCVHPGRDGAYLIDLTWFAAFYGRSPEGIVLPVGTSLTAEQARALQRLAWDVVENYPDCGLYREGTTPVGPPEASPAPAPIAAVTPVTLSSTTPGSWFRYTLDGTTPTRIRGYVYCGVISVRPGMTLKAMAFKSGMADSPVTQADYPAPPTAGGAAPPLAPAEHRVAGSLQPFVDGSKLAGAVVLVADRDKLLTLETVGFADVAARKPMRPDTLFWIASQSKPITATALMMLVDEGKVRLDDPVEKYLPEFKEQWVAVERDQGHILLKRPKQRVTVRHLLSHTSGLPFKSALEQPTLDGLPLRVAAGSYAMTPLQWEPGTRYQYANAGINTVGRIIEVVSGVPYEEFLEKRLFGPLGMKDTTFGPGPEQIARLAKSYRPKADGTGLEEISITQLRYPLDDRGRQPMPAGGLFSTAGDVGRFCQMILGGGVYDGRRYLSESAVAEMTSRQTGDSIKESYGLGWATTGARHENGGPTIPGPCGHGGAYATNMWIDPRRELISVYMVQYAGPGQEGGKMRSAFMKAAEDAFAKK